MLSSQHTTHPLSIPSHSAGMVYFALESEIPRFSFSSHAKTSQPPHKHNIIKPEICFKTCSAPRCINCDISGGFKCLLFPIGLPGGFFRGCSDPMARFAIEGPSSSFPPSPVLRDLHSPGWGYLVRLTHGPWGPLAFSGYFVHNIYKLFFFLIKIYLLFPKIRIKEAASSYNLS